MNSYGRIYKNASTCKLLRLKTFFITCRFPIFVKNLNNMYSFSCKVVGKKVTNGIIKHMYGDVFLAGETTSELEKSLQEIKKEGLIGISDYAREFLTKEEERLEIESIIQMYKDSIDTSIRVDEKNSIAMKVSSFGDVEMMKKMNTLQYTLTILENEIRKSSSYEQIIETFSKHKIPYKISEIFVNQLKEMKIKEFDLNIFEIILSENNNLLNDLKICFKIKEKELKEMIQFVKTLNSRLNIVFDHAKRKNCLIMIDAEQSYLRFITDVISAYYFKKFNSGHKCIVAQTLQCYLKTQQEDLVKWRDFCRKNNIRFALKLVRGAYMSEESRIAKEKGTESPVCSSIDETHDNYNKSIEYVFDNYQEGDKFCIATHNLASIALTGQFYKFKGRNEDIFCAQLLGIADHATGFCRKYEVKLAKYMPFGNFDILIPYLIRRAEESSMISKLKVQNDLLNEELFIRFAFWKKINKVKGDIEKI